MDSNIQGRPAASVARTQALLRPLLSALCSAGCGLVLWVALSGTMLAGGTAAAPRLLALQAWGLVLGAALAAAGLGLLWPHPASRSPWRRGRLTALLLVVASAVALALPQGPAQDPRWQVVLAVVACGSALAAILCQALPETGQAGLLLPARLAQALLCGAGLLFALIALRWPGPLAGTGPVPSLLVLVVAAGGLLAATWQGGVLPWRDHRGRWLALGLVAATPLLLAALLYLQPGWGRVLWPLVALSAFAGAVAERLQPH